MKTLESLRAAVYGIINPLTDWLVRQRVHPNTLTTLGFIVTMSLAFFYHDHHIRIAGFLILLGGFFDIIDGRVARLSGLGSKFGAFYDSTLDRISEIAVFFGILSLYNSYRQALGDVCMIYLPMLAMAGSLMVSYTRGRADALGLDCRAGLLCSAERVVLIVASSLFFAGQWNGLATKVVIFRLAVLTNLTALQRIVWVWQHARRIPIDATPARAPEKPSRSSDEAEVVEQR